MRRERGASLGFGTVIAIIAGVAAFGVVLTLGVVGVGRTVAAGTQTQLCGTQVGVSVSGDTVRLLGTDTGTLAVGERARISAFCVIELVGVQESGASGEADADGGGARVQLRWRLW